MDITYFYGLPRADLLRHIHQMLQVLTEAQLTACFSKEVKKLSKPSSRSLIDWSTVPLRHIAIQVCYDGVGYAGLAQQSSKEYTIEEVLLNAIKDAALIPQNATMQDVHFERSGRTDRGVSAAGQVFSFYARTNNKDAAPQPISNPDPRFFRDRRDGLTPETVSNANETDPIEPKIKHVQPALEIDYVAAINSKLPETIRVLGWAPVDENFSARHSTSFRMYIYTFGCVGHLNIERMADACSRLVGFHDFRNFCKPALDNVRSFERVIFNCHLEINGVRYENAGDVKLVKPEAQLSLVVCGSAFLYHQIRYIASLLIHIGAELEPPTLISDLLDVQKYPGKPDYPIAPGELLLFNRAGYTQTRLSDFYLSNRSYQFLSKNLRFLQTKAMSHVRLYEAALKLLTENKSVLSGAPFASDDKSIELVPKPCDHPLVGTTLTHKITGTCERYVENGLSMIRLEKYTRIASRTFDATFEKRLEERKKEVAAYKEGHKDIK